LTARAQYVTASLLTQRGNSLAAFLRERGGEAWFLAFNSPHIAFNVRVAPYQTLPKVNEFGELGSLGSAQKVAGRFCAALHNNIQIF